MQRILPKLSNWVRWTLGILLMVLLIPPLAVVVLALDGFERLAGYFRKDS